MEQFLPPKYSLYDIEAKRGDKILWQKRGLFDYDRNIFVLPKGMFERGLTPEDKEIVEHVGYELK